MQQRQLFQRTIQSAKLALWHFRRGTLGIRVFGQLCVVKVQASVFQRMRRAQEQVFQKVFQILCRRMNTLLQVVIIRTHQRVTKIPGMIHKRFVVHIQTKALHIFDDKDCRCACVTFSKGMNLPDA